ncbi:MAG: hypothetical protein ACRD26_12850 [Vicinamibacterales bacterium]
MKLFAEFEKTPDRSMRDAVAIQRTFKVIGRDEVYLLVRAESTTFLDQALAPFQDRADITVTPLVEQE